MILLKLLSIENRGILHLFNVLRCVLFISPLGLDRHIQALCVRVQWIWQSTASGDFLASDSICPSWCLPYNYKWQLELIFENTDDRTDRCYTIR